MRCFQTLFTFALVAFSADVVHAGPRSGGGGDLCENRIQVVRDDISAWIGAGGGKYLKLPSEITADQYALAMESQIDNTKVSCVGQGDTNYPVQINGTPKICIFLEGAEKQIICDFNKFQKLSQSDQYVLIHHEYAGLAGIEVPNGADSKYSVSNQIAAFIENTVVAHLVVKDLSAPSETSLYCVSRIVVEGQKEENVRGPELSLSGQNRKIAMVPGYSNFKPWHWAYTVTAQRNGSVAVDIDLGKQADLRRKDGGRDSTSATHAIGFTTGNAFLEAYSWLYPNFSISTGCKIAVFRVVCAATEPLANKAANVCAGAVSDKDICLPTTSRMPKGCSL